MSGEGPYTIREAATGRVVALGDGDLWLENMPREAAVQVVQVLIEELPEIAAELGSPVELEIVDRFGVCYTFAQFLESVWQQKESEKRWLDAQA